MTIKHVYRTELILNTFQRVYFVLNFLSDLVNGCATARHNFLMKKCFSCGKPLLTLLARELNLMLLMQGRSHSPFDQKLIRTITIDFYHAEWILYRPPNYINKEYKSWNIITVKKWSQFIFSTLCTSAKRKKILQFSIDFITLHSVVVVEQQGKAANNSCYHRQNNTVFGSSFVFRNIWSRPASNLLLSRWCFGYLESDARLRWKTFEIFLQKWPGNIIYFLFAYCSTLCCNLTHILWREGISLPFQIVYNSQKFMKDFSAIYPFMDHIHSVVALGKGGPLCKLNGGHFSLHTTLTCFICTCN